MVKRLYVNLVQYIILNNRSVGSTYTLVKTILMCEW